MVERLTLSHICKYVGVLTVMLVMLPSDSIPRDDGNSGFQERDRRVTSGVCHRRRREKSKMSGTFFLVMQGKLK